jgi:hypothetical protein
MTNPFSPPRAPVENPSDAHDDYRMKSANRPNGILVVVVLFFVFSVLDVAVLLVAGDTWWTVVLGLTALLAYLFRKLWWGDERERRIAVFFGFFGAAISLFGFPDEPIPSWSAQDYVSIAEGGYLLLAASYLVYVRKSPFFSAREP